MPKRFEPKLASLPKAQQEIWPLLAPAPKLGLVLYGGTAVALQLGHRTSEDFDFFSDRKPLDKELIRKSFAFMRGARVVQDEVDTLVVVATMPSGDVKVSFFGVDIGRVNAPLATGDATLLVASLDDLLATKLKTILDRAEAKDYRDISAMLSSGVSLAKALGAFKAMYQTDPAVPLRAIGYFKEGDLPSLPGSDKNNLMQARDRISAIPDVAIDHGPLPGA